MFMKISKNPISNHSPILLPSKITQSLCFVNIPSNVYVCMRAFMLHALNLDKYVFVENV